MVKTPRRLAAIAAFALALPGASSAAISGLKWTLEEGVSISGDILAAELADPSGSALARAQIDVSAHLGDETAAAFSFRMRAFGVAGREAAYNGVKATVAYRDASGAAQYPQVSLPEGTFGWTNGTVHVSWLRGLPANGQTFNVGTFALLWAGDPFVLSVR